MYVIAGPELSLYWAPTMSFISRLACASVTSRSAVYVEGILFLKHGEYEKHTGSIIKRKFDLCQESLEKLVCSNAE